MHRYQRQIANSVVTRLRCGGLFILQLTILTILQIYRWVCLWNNF